MRKLLVAAALIALSVCARGDEYGFTFELRTTVLYYGFPACGTQLQCGDSYSGASDGYAAGEDQALGSSLGYPASVAIHHNSWNADPHGLYSRDIRLPVGSHPYTGPYTGPYCYGMSWTDIYLWMGPSPYPGLQPRELRLEWLFTQRPESCIYLFALIVENDPTGKYPNWSIQWTDADGGMPGVVLGSLTWSQGLLAPLDLTDQTAANGVHLRLAVGCLEYVYDQTVPEPSGLLALASGVLAAGLTLRRR